MACTDQKNQKIRVAAAANLQFALVEVLEEFEHEYNLPCELITSSSGKLTAQILSGAPYDLFISADMKYPEQLFSQNFAETPPEIYAKGHLVLWSKKGIENLGLESLMNEGVKHIALANPETAPYGKAAMEVLDKMNDNDQIKSKLVFGESISQTNQFIYSEAADVGFTSISTVLSNQVNQVGSWSRIDSSLYAPINQGVVVLKRQNINSKNAQLLKEFLFSKKAQKIFRKFGYST